MAKNEKPIPINKLNQFCEENAIEYFKVSGFNVESCTINEFQENHRHSHYEIIWLKKGKGIHHIDGQSYNYNGSVLFLLSPGQVHKIEQEQRGEGFVIKFLPELFQHQKDVEEYLIDSLLFDAIESFPVINLTASQYKVFEDLFYQITVEFNTSEMGQQQILSSFLKILITNISRLKRSQQTINFKPELGYELFRNYKISIEKNYKNVHSVNEYAALLKTTPRTLNNLAKKFSDKTAGQLISERILLEAKRQLHHNTLSVKEIAFELGYDDPAYFTRFFKNSLGISPQQYKSTITV
ncbi:helix-turn-helix domain-containing protein [Flavobacterium sedimenticola]|uniref:Helix-turn-helix domain-containing protein n=1 Tax=Flavobacterium sedimenticola TaxID=3043286 RepID=A0ABT6XS96_9FLAO|nr:helix-turn-helix domain-containing protein [Flavobacterium sedimenticola]MDI9257926.1 helix-turn-helix domain-containing protein [Flavobacterium sedimenticola]